jgi:hypothetical protein
MTCINLLAMFGEQYRITFDEAYDPTHVPIGRRDPWMMQIPCEGQRVTIYPHGGTALAVEVDRRPSIAAKLQALAGVKLHQDGDIERTFLFDVSLFDQVAQIVKPRRRRRLTDKQRETLLKYGRRFEAGAQKTTPERAQTTSGDISLTPAEVAPLPT